MTHSLELMCAWEWGVLGPCSVRVVFVFGGGGGNIKYKEGAHGRGVMKKDD